MTRALVIVALFTIAAGAIASAGGGPALVLEVAVLPLAIGALIGTGLAAADHAQEEPDDVGRTRDLEDRPHASMAGRVRAAARSRHDVHTQLLPVLRPLARDVCLDHGVDPDDRVAVTALLGEDLVALLDLRRDPLHDRDADGIPVAHVARMVDRLETLA